MSVYRFLLGLLLAAAGLPAVAAAAEVSAAVAANFIKPAEELGAAFAARTGDTVTFSFGATGGLYTQISQGAPFEVLLAADNQRPALAVREGFGIRGTVFTYAVGKLALYSPTLDVTDGAAVLAAGNFQHIAIANPGTAPYGAAAMQAVEALGLTVAMAPKTVTGGNISQTLQFIESGNAELGFVALSQLADESAPKIWLVPADHYAPILQDAVLLKAGAANPAAAAFLDFLKSDEARGIIESYGYAMGQ